MKSSPPFLLCVAGEDSGDRLGAPVVRAARALGYAVRGAGGAAMAGEGLEPLVPYEDLAVCGVGDVLRRLPRLNRHLRTLQRALRDKDCVGLVCIDYPGFNLHLQRLADRAGKPSWYVAPPQIWAWKYQRGAQFSGRHVAVLFPFEQEAYARWGAQAILVRHPALSRIAPPREHGASEGFLLLPGSRLPQLKRNLDLYMRLASELQVAAPGAPIVFVASRPSLQTELRKHVGNLFEVRLYSDFPAGFSGARGLVCTPGTATLEAALAGVPTLVTTVTDPLTYALGKGKLSLPYLSLPNLLLKREQAKEAIFAAFPGFRPTASRIRGLARGLADEKPESWHWAAHALRTLLNAEPLERIARTHLQPWLAHFRAARS